MLSQTIDWLLPVVELGNPSLDIDGAAVLEELRVELDLGDLDLEDTWLTRIIALEHLGDGRSQLGLQVASVAPG